MKQVSNIGCVTHMRVNPFLTGIIFAFLSIFGGTTFTMAETPVATITAPSGVTGEQAGYAAYVAAQTGATYEWTITNGTIMVGQSTDGISFKPGSGGTVTLACKVTISGSSATGTVSIPITPAKTPEFTMEKTLYDPVQGTTIAFAGIGMMTGNLGAQSFYPPGKVADYWGFQYLRDNDADRMGHNTSFQFRVAYNMIYTLNDSQVSQLKTLAKYQVSNINLFAWKRYPLMTAFRRLLDNDMPTGATGLNLDQVKAASRDVYILDGQISYERAVVYADIFRSLTTEQKKYIGSMVGKSFNSWPDISEQDIQDKTQGLSHDERVALNVYAGDVYSWFSGSVNADIYFCPERHGTYFGAFYIKDAPAMGHPGYSIDEYLTGTVGNALCDSREGYISAAGAAKMNALVETQRQNLYASSTSNMVLARTKISEALRSLITSGTPSDSFLASVKSTVETYSGIYGELDGENNYHYAKTFYELYRNIGGTYITDSQKEGLAALRKKYMTVTYTDGTTVDYSNCEKFYLYVDSISPTSAEFLFYTSDAVTDSLFGVNTITLSIKKVGTGSGEVTATGCTLTWSGTTGTCTADAGTVITLIATAGSGSFTGWIGEECSGTGTCQVTLGASTTILAFFRSTSGGFSDVPIGYWAENYIESILAKGITTGCSSNSFCPSLPVTNEQMAAFIIRAIEGEPASSYCSSGSPFSDVSSTAWSCRYIKRINELGIMTGCGNGKFCPSSSVLRWEMAKYLVTANEGSNISDYCSQGSSFTDVLKTDSFCRYTERLQQLGITNGCGTGLYCPYDTVNRDTMAAFLSRAFLGLALL